MARTVKRSEARSRSSVAMNLFIGYTITSSAVGIFVYFFASCCFDVKSIAFAQFFMFFVLPIRSAFVNGLDAVASADKLKKCSDINLF